LNQEEPNVKEGADMKSGYFYFSNAKRPSNI